MASVDSGAVEGLDSIEHSFYLVDGRTGTFICRRTAKHPGADRRLTAMGTDLRALAGSTIRRAAMLLVAAILILVLLPAAIAAAGAGGG